MISIITPTYNRAHLLTKLYASLKPQTFRDFEWIVVDDGSTDDTQIAVQNFIQDATFTINYIHKENGGKHSAVNLGVKEAKGELVFIVDSDDTLPEDSLQIINRYWQQVKDDTNFGGIVGYMAHHDGKIIGNGNDDEVLDCTELEMRYRYNIHGDMCEVFRTSVLKEFPFPVYDGERFCPEALVWNRIATKYRLRVFHEIIYFRDYLEGGITDHMTRVRMNSPVASVTYYKELIEYAIPLKEKIKGAINYWRFYFCLKNKEYAPLISPRWYWTRPLGWAMHCRDKSNA